MTHEQEVLQQFITKRTEVRRVAEELRQKLQQQAELLLRVEGAIEAFGLIGIALPSDGAEGQTESPE